MDQPVLVRVTAIADGMEDPDANAIISEDGLIIDSFALGMVGISWKSLRAVLEYQLAMDKLQEAELE